LQLLRKMDADRQIRSLVCSDGANHRGEGDSVQPFDGSYLYSSNVAVEVAGVGVLIVDIA
jgi:proline racemase